MTPIRINQLLWAGTYVVVGTFSSASSADTIELSQRQMQPAAEISAGKHDVRAAQRRIRDALHADPYFYDKHVTASVDKDRIVLQGFVFSDWDLETALRIARGAAGGVPVINNLSIKEGGRP